ncbi:PqiA/YebS family transporter subunit [Pseudoalteromonas fenneropenaei]|uniref:PqiA/YebS family transporter subunit n=1 Tax=Pseudoalteromonas fenneropenaei TaxID=1737459 RepID=A0ABV7CMF7_9GAMM
MSEQCVVCQHCDHFIAMPTLNCGERAYCPVCHAPVKAPELCSTQHILAFAIAAIILLFTSVSFEFVSFAKGGLFHSFSLLSALPTLAENKGTALALLLALVIVILPLTLLSIIIIAYSPLWLRLNLIQARRLTKFLSSLEPWSMTEIFLLAILISLIKLISLAEVRFGLSFWSYCAFVCCFVQAMNLLDKQILWERVRPYRPPNDVNFALSASSQGFKVCSTCGQIAKTSRCPRCHTKLHLRKPASIEKVLAWLMTSAILFFPANLLPIMTTTQLHQSTPATIFSGVVQLWQSGSYPIATVIFVASILIPLLKMAAITALLLQSKRFHHGGSAKYTELYRLIEFIGKWSMIDVFVVLFLVALVQLGILMSVNAEIGVLFFALMVFSQIMTVHYFDPRLIWDDPKEPYGKSDHYDS